MKSIKRFICVSGAILMAVSPTFSALACTSMGVGKDASADGSVMVTHTCDGWYDHRIKIIPGGTHEEGDMVDIYRDPCTATMKEPEKVGEIPQAETTYTYFNIGYPFMNEKQVMMGEFTWSGRDEVSNPQGLFVIANLEQIGLQRAGTAREAIQIMGEMAEKYGYCDGGETLIVGDPNEAWVFEICGGGMLWQPDSGKAGAHWAAKRIPDDQAFVGANRSRIDVIDFEDKENFMYSESLTEMPEQMGWWKPGEEFHFAKIFNPEPYSGPFYASRREGRVFSLMAPSQDFEVIDRYEHYPFSIKPDEKLSVQDITNIYSDHYEGTDYDLTKGLAAGPFGNPTRWGVKGDQKPEAASKDGHDWERSIALYRCSYSFVSQSRSWLPDPVGGVLWFGQDSPDTTVYVPLYCGTTEVPESWSSGMRDKFDPDCAWWAFNFVNNWANLRWDAMYEEIRAKKASYEDVFFADQAAVEEEAAKLYAEDPAKAAAFITEYVNKNMNTVEEGWWEFAWYLVGKYYDGMCIGEDGTSTTLGYPKEYLEAVNYGDTSIRDFAVTSGKGEEAEEEETTAVETAATETAATETAATETTAAETAAPAETEANAPAETPQESGSATTPIIVVAVVVMIVAGLYLFNRSRKNNQ